MIKLYGAILSPYVRKSLFVLTKKQLSFELVPQMPFRADDDFLKISTLGKVPAHGFLFSDEMLTADIALVSPLINAEIVGYCLDAKLWPQLCAFLERVKSHQVMQPILAAEEKFLSR